MKRILYSLLAMVILLSLTLAMAVPAMAAPGSIWTTTISGVQDANVQYNAKSEVYLNGRNLPATVYIQVVTPNGNPLSNVKQYSTTNGNLSLVHLVDILTTYFGGNPGFDTTDNSGGEYKVHVSNNADMGNAKSDNFKVKSKITIVKKSLGQGVFDFSWKLGSGSPTSFTITSDAATTPAGWFSGSNSLSGLGIGTYTITENVPSDWICTSENPQTVIITDEGDFTVTYTNEPKPGNPTPEMPAVALLGFGVAGIGAFVYFQRRKSVTTV